jgi:lysophospholipase L1-like esterase
VVSYSPPAGSGGAAAPDTKFQPIANGAYFLKWGHSYFTGGNANNGKSMDQTLNVRHAWGNAIAGLNRSSAGRRTIDVAREAVSFFVPGQGMPAPGIHLVMAGVNDDYGDLANWPGMPAVGLATMRAILNILRSTATRIEDTPSGTVVYTGVGWANVVDANASGGNYRKTATQGEFVEVTATVPASGEVIVLLQGVSSTSPGATGLGATFSVTVDGGAPVNGTTAFGAQAGAATLPMTVLLTGVTPGSRVIRVTKTDATANELRFDAVLMGATSKPTILMIQQPAPTPSKSAAFIAACRQTMVDARAFYPANEVLIVDPTGWDAPTMLTSDNLHPNDRGHAWFVAGIEAVMATLSFREGQNRLVA